jgi:CRISPR system Cascade subunit CasA
MAATAIAIPVLDWRNSMHNLLLDPIFRVDTPEGTQCLSLPALLAALGADHVNVLPGLQRHQEDAFHIFLCYLAGAVLARANQNAPRQSEAFWRDELHKLAGRDDDCAWTLVVDDPMLPAFLQSPASSKEKFERDFTSTKETPDALDVLLLAKNHDGKMHRLSCAALDDWVYSLISLQTMAGYILKHQGIARMNSGLGSRPCVSLVESPMPGRRWQDDLTRLLPIRDSLLRPPWPYDAKGVVLTWIPVWDRESSLPLENLDPFFIEISRGVRMVKRRESIVVRTATEKAPRISAKLLNGVLGDPWTPINTEDAKKGLSSLTVSDQGFTPKLLRDLVFGDGRFQLQAMQRPVLGREKESCDLHATVLVRGQGKTDGFHQASIPIPGKAISIFARSTTGLDHLSDRSKVAIHDAGVMENDILKQALYSMFEAGPERVSDWVDQTTRQFAEAWADRYFTWLWDSLEEENEDAARLKWLTALRTMAWQVLQDAMDRLPLRTGRGYRSRVRAESVFHGCLYKHFEELKPESKKESVHDDSHRANSAI